MDRYDLWLVRHGETTWSASGRHTGRTDVPLTDAGRAAARRLGHRLAGADFRLVLTSPMSRARDSCRLARLDRHAEVLDDLNEWDYGDYEGLTTAQIRETRPGWMVFADGCPGGETAGGVGRRADRVIERARAADGPVAVFGHGHMLRVVAARWVGLPAAAGATLAFGTASVGVLGWEREVPVLSRWNC